MTDAELIARLRDDVFYGDERLHNLSRHNPLHMEAADRIEALVKEKDQEYKDNIVRMAGQAKDFMEEISTLKTRIEALSISNATLIAERDQWIAYAKTAIWSDSEELKETERKLEKAVEALEEISEYDTGATAGLAYTAKHHLAEIKSGIATTPYGLEGESHE